MKHLALLFCSIRPEQLSEEVCDYREEEYYKSLLQFQRIIPNSFEIIVCENTVNSLDAYKNKDLSSLLSKTNLIMVGKENNVGSQNKGMGELIQLKVALDSIDTTKYQNISYVTARRFYTCPYVFERTETMTKNALLSNPDFVFFDGRVLESYKQNCFNDMFFSMRSDIMKQYADYSINKMQDNIANSVGSEYNLYNFVSENNLDYEWLEWLGIVRNAWDIDGNKNNLNNYHIC